MTLSLKTKRQISSLIVKISSIKQRIYQMMTAIGLSVMSSLAYAQLNLLGDANIDTESGILTTIKSTFSNLFTIAVLIINVIMFVAAGWFILTALAEARSGKKEWSEFFVTVGISIAAILVINYFLNLATTGNNELAA